MTLRVSMYDFPGTSHVIHKSKESRHELCHVSSSAPTILTTASDTALTMQPPLVPIMTVTPLLCSVPTDSTAVGPPTPTKAKQKLTKHLTDTDKTSRHIHQHHNNF
ncbi:hypothetical protein KIL84_003016 [Mauremys mutica]|uniref:Uncharacterized protein n=1 Tax=Mauremys mutica TaxID=74926 RepID=A0A9D4AQS4_9SAUR|nr:hypothetical protein KIL84_003016 [Mauremys mutica]